MAALEYSDLPGDSEFQKQTSTFQSESCVGFYNLASETRPSLVLHSFGWKHFGSQEGREEK